jgi:hypothetical protein
MEGNRQERLTADPAAGHSPLRICSQDFKFFHNPLTESSNSHYFFVVLKNISCAFASTYGSLLYLTAAFQNENMHPIEILSSLLVLASLLVAAPIPDNNTCLTLSNQITATEEALSYNRYVRN